MRGHVLIYLGDGIISLLLLPKMEKLSMRLEDLAGRLKAYMKTRYCALIG